MNIRRFLFSGRVMLICFSILLITGCTTSIDSRYTDVYKLQISDELTIKHPEFNIEQINKIHNEGVEADFPFFATMEEMEERAMAVVVGEIVDYLGIQEVKLTEDFSMSYHIYAIRIHESLKGMLDPEQKILLKVLAGDVAEDASKLLHAQHRSYLLYLDIYSDSPATLISPAQALIAWDPAIGILYTDTARTFIESGSAKGLSAQAARSLFD